jgi:zinc transport system substrate-binding protein
MVAMRKFSVLVMCVMLLNFSPAFAAEATAPKVVVTIKPLYSLVAAVMGDVAKPELLLTGILSPHGFQLTPSQAKMLEDADLVFFSDDALEHYVVDTLHDKQDSSRIALGQAEGVMVLPPRKSGVWGEKKSDHEEHHEHEDSVVDPHTWLDTDNAMAMVKAIEATLSARYPEHVEVFKRNALAAITRITATDVSVRHKLAGVKEKPFIVFHDAYQYFEQHYGLRGEGSLTLEPEMPVSAGVLQKVRNKIKQSKVVCVFREPQFSDKTVKAAMEGTKAIGGTLDELGADLEPSAELYPALLEKMSDAFVACFDAGKVKKK